MSSAIESLTNPLVQVACKSCGKRFLAGRWSPIQVFFIFLILFSVASDAWPTLVGRWRFDEGCFAWASRMGK